MNATKHAIQGNWDDTHNVWTSYDGRLQVRREKDRWHLYQKQLGLHFLVSSHDRYSQARAAAVRLWERR